MRLATFVTKLDPARTRIGVLAGEQLLDISTALRDETTASAEPFRTMRDLLALGGDAFDRLRVAAAEAVNHPHRFAGALFSFGEIRFLPPIPDPDKFLCIGKNYRTHLDELRKTGLIKESPEEPTGFIKLNSCLTGHECDVSRPATVTRLDYEPELVFVIGKRAFQVRAENALEHVAGVTILNDLTCRDTQKREVASGSRFWTAKNAPGFGPLGPFIITMDEVKDPYDIWVTCSVNGEQRMRVNTSEQIWRVPTIIEHFSRLLPLEPGDMLSTGAPGGVAVGKPNAEALFLRPGDVVECAFEAPAMTLRTRIVAPE